MAIAVNPSAVSILKSEARLPGWNISGAEPRSVFNSKGYVLKPSAQKYQEQKREKRASRNEQPEEGFRSYDNPLFEGWQRRLANALHDGSHVIVDVATSCGKTWAANMAITYETLMSDKNTTLIVTPNSEVMRESVRDICENNTKRYIYPIRRMLDTVSRNYATFNDRHNPNSQIVVISSESFVDFITKDINRRFVEALRFVVFDEVHLPAVSQGLWWVQFIPQSAQLVLLSATLGNKRYLTKIIAKMYGYTDQDDSSSESTDDQDDSSSDDQDDSSSDDQDDSSSESTDESLERYTMPGALRSIVTIKYHIRPIPLQYAVYTESLAPQKGLMSPELVRAGKISCIVNPYDPTVRDTLSIDKKAVIPQGRDAQHQASLQVVSDNLSNVKVNIKEAIARAVQDSDAATVYNLLAYLFSNDMQPVMVFSVTAENTQSLAEALVSHITQTESSDPVYRSARKLEEKYERAGHRSRDEDGHGAASAVKADKATERSMQRAKDKVRGEIEDEDLSVINIHEVRATLKRWRFPMELESFPRKCPQWIQDAMECGIGVYTSTMPNWLRHHVFDVFKAGKIRVILADSSISVGINLPIRTCILCGDDMTPVVFRQASGRAGRRGYDTQGYVIPLCSRKLIARCFMERLTDVNISLPEAMSYSSLIRLSIPVNLDNFYRSEKFREQREPVSEYKTGIMERYLGTLDKAGRELYHAQMSLIEKEGWNYHRLSNLIKNLPGESNMIIIRLLVTGTLHKFTWQEFVDLLSVVMFRVEDSSGSVPTFERFARMTDFLQSFADRYGIKVDYRKPISDYLQRFMVDGVLDVSRLPEIEALGEWLYVMKREVNCVAPVHDDFRKLINQVDDFYIRARRRRNF